MVVCDATFSFDTGCHKNDLECRGLGWVHGLLRKLYTLHCTKSWNTDSSTFTSKGTCWRKFEL